MSMSSATLIATLLLATPPITPPADVAAAAEAPDSGLALPKGEARAVYALKLMGQTIGAPVIEMGAVQTLKDGREVRKMLFQTGISERLMRLYPADTKFVGVLDAATYKPMQTSYDILEGETRRSVKLRFKGATMSADKVQDGKPEQSVDKYEPGMTDTVSAMGWLAARGVKPGETTSTPHHSGNFRYRLYITGEEPEETRVPAGTFPSLRVRCRLYLWPEGTPDAARDAWPTSMEPYTTWTVWLADDAWHTPVRIQADVGVLGQVEMQLTNRRLK